MQCLYQRGNDLDDERVKAVNLTMNLVELFKMSKYSNFLKGPDI